MEKEHVEVPHRTHDQPAEGGREQADQAVQNDEQTAAPPPEDQRREG